MNMMQPNASLLCKLGSIAVHTEELLSPYGHDLDQAALNTLLADAEVIEWLAMMDGAAMVPKKRVVPA